MLKIIKLAVHGLPPLSFEVERGECLAIEGPSGSGKSLLLRAIADLDVSGGQVILDGVERASVSAPVWRQRVRYVAAEARWWAPSAAAHCTDRATASNLLERLGLPPAILDKPIEVLSTGERQRLALVRALLDDPPVLLLDEPTGALDAVSRDAVEQLIETRLAASVHVLLVSHDTQQIERLAHARLQLAPVLRSAPETVLPTTALPAPVPDLDHHSL